MQDPTDAPKRTRRTKAEMEAARAETISTATPVAAAMASLHAGQSADRIAARSEPDYEDVRFNSVAEFTSHAFKLAVSTFKKHFLPDNIRPSQADWLNMEHVHIFHTQTSDGKEQIHSNAVGGHFHILSVERAPKGKVPRVTCTSGPKRFIAQKDAYGVKRKVIADFNPGIDTHTHDVEYIGSSKVKPRTINPEATKVISSDAEKLAPIPDVVF